MSEDRDDETPVQWWSEDDDDAGLAPTFGEQDADPDPCPLGGEHDWIEVRSATEREPLMVYCGKCKEEGK